jgi:hypothetical protein
MAPDNTDPNKPAINPAACTNVTNPVSFVLTVDTICNTFPYPACQIRDKNAAEYYSDNSGNLPPGIQSTSCSLYPGTVNGVTTRAA